MTILDSGLLLGHPVYNTAVEPYRCVFRKCSVIANLCVYTVKAAFITHKSLNVAAFAGIVNEPPSFGVC